jgi:hypothetical protein
MSTASDNVSDTIGKLEEAIKVLAEQDKGEKEVVPFLKTLLDAFSVDDLGALLEEFDTSWYNDEWVSILDDEEKSEEEDGVRLRVAVVFLARWKKALLRACSFSTDVDKLDRSTCGILERAYESMFHTDQKLARTESNSDTGDDDG